MNLRRVFADGEVDLKTEFIAGLTTFLTSAYIVAVNPFILSQAGMDQKALIVITCLASGIATLMMAIWPKVPVEPPARGERLGRPVVGLRSAPSPCAAPRGTLSWPLPSTCSSRSARTASTRSGSSTTSRLNAGTTSSVTVETMPSAPRPTLAQWKTSASSRRAIGE